MKKKAWTFLSLICIAFAGCFVLSSCGESEPKVNKVDYGKALTSVSSTLKADNTARPVDYNMYNDDFIITTNKEGLIVLSKFVDLANSVCTSESFEFITTPFTFNLDKIDGTNDATIKMQFGTNDEDLEFKFIMTDNMESVSYYQYLNITIDYNFEEDKLEKFSIKDFYKYSSNATSYHYYEYQDGTIKMLKPIGDIYYNSKDEAQLEAKEYLESEHIATAYNFTAVYNSIMSAS